MVKRKILELGESWTAPLNVRKIKASLCMHNNKVISSGLNDASHITRAGYTYGWGLNDFGQIGDNSTTPKSTPVAIISGNPNASVIASGGKHTIFADLTSGRTVTGKGINGQLGDTTVISKSTPTTIAGAGGFSFPLVTLAATLNSSFGVSWNNVYYGWGLNESGVLGLNDITPRSSAVSVSAWATSLSVQYGFSGGRAHLVGWGVNGGAASGENTYGQLGDGSTTHKSTPTAIAGGLKWRMIAAGGDHCLGLTKDGSLYAWGRNNVGQLGINTLATTGTSSPVLVSAPVGVKFADVACGTDHSYALARDGRLFSWGGNAHGQLGLGDTTNRSSPAVVSTSATFVQLNGSCGNYRSMAVSKSGNVFMWGNGAHGALGNNSTSSLSTPKMVVGDSDNATIMADYSIIESFSFDIEPGQTLTAENDNGTYLTLGGYRVSKRAALTNTNSQNYYFMLEY